MKLLKVESSETTSWSILQRTMRFTKLTSLNAQTLMTYLRRPKVFRKILAPEYSALGNAAPWLRQILLRLFNFTFHPPYRSLRDTLQAVNERKPQLVAPSVDVLKEAERRTHALMNFAKSYYEHHFRIGAEHTHLCGGVSAPKNMLKRMIYCSQNRSNSVYKFARGMRYKKLGF